MLVPGCELDHYESLVGRTGILKIAAAGSHKKQHYSQCEEKVATDALDSRQNLGGMAQ